MYFTGQRRRSLEYVPSDPVSSKPPFSRNKLFLGCIFLVQDLLCVFGSTRCQEGKVSPCLATQPQVFSRSNVPASLSPTLVPHTSARGFLPKPLAVVAPYEERKMFLLSGGLEETQPDGTYPKDLLLYALKYIVEGAQHCMGFFDLEVATRYSVLGDVYAGCCLSPAASFGPYRSPQQKM
jgi:hypothetical protein